MKISVYDFWRDASQTCETKSVTVGRNQLLTSLVVTNEGNRAHFSKSRVFLSRYGFMAGCKSILAKSLQCS